MQTSYTRMSDAQWEIIKHFLDWQRKRQLDLREIFNAILYVGRTGIQWRNLEETNFPDWQAVYYYFAKWKKTGVFEKINFYVNRFERKLLKRNTLPSLGLVDSQSIKLAPMIAEQRGVDGNKQVNGRKRHILTDVRGRIYKVHIHAANRHDSPQGVHLFDEMEVDLEALEKILADKTYRGTFAKAVEKLGLTFELPQRPEGVKGFVVEAKRWAVERSFAWLNFFRRTVIDYERTTESAESFVILANIAMVIHKIAI